MVEVSTPLVEKNSASVVYPEKSTPLSSLLKHWLFLLIALVFIGSIGALPLIGRDEPRYVEIGREMMQSGDWITPHLGGFHWFEKPALLYWLVAASFSVFGVSEWSARLGAALCGLGTVALVWDMARRVQSGNVLTVDSAPKNPLAFWCALALASCGGMLAFSHGATFDIVLTFAITVALYGFYMAQVEEEKSRINRFLAIFWIGVGLACLAKGLVAFVLTFGAVGIYAPLRRERVKLGLLWGLPLSLLVAGTWYGPMFLHNGKEFWDQFFVQHQFQRFTSDKFKHHQPPWFYLEMLPLLVFPWTPFLIAALWKIRLPLLRENSNESRFLALGVAWTLIPVLFFSVSGSKLPSYILPAIPGAFLLIGWAINRWVYSTKRMTVVQSVAALTLVLAGVLTTFGPGVHRAEKSSVRSLLQLAYAKNLESLPVVEYQSMQRGVQFYDANHLIYGKNHEPLQFDELSQLASFAHKQPVLVLSDSKESLEIRQSLRGEIIGDNGETALILVR